jgi:ergothioneine biosynthesis protein EgtB
MSPSLLAGARKQTDRLFDLVHPDALYDRPIPERHRIIFYVGHLEAFDWNLLRPGMGKEPFDPKLDRLFAFGIDPVDGGLPSDVPSDWPAVEEIHAYRKRVREAVDAAEHDPVLLHMVREHRLMHAETLAYMLHQLPLERKRSEAQIEVEAREPAAAEWIQIPSGCATLGAPRNGHFAWDNERDAHQAFVQSFEMGRYKVTNREYLRFVEDGGYRDRSLWTGAAWEWKEDARIVHPVFWKPEGSSWLYRGMFEEIPLPADWPVYVSHAEANAYAHWVGARLPSEAEWHRAAYREPDGGERPFPWGADPPDAQRGYFDFARWDPSPVNAFPHARSAFGVEGLLANGWEWTATQFAPFAGFEIHPGYPGYSADFFDGKHYVLKGGSARTDASMLRRSFRNWFQPHYQYVYAGFRCAAGTKGV